MDTPLILKMTGTWIECCLFHVPVATLHNISRYAERREMILKCIQKIGIY